MLVQARKPQSPGIDGVVVPIQPVTLLRLDDHCEGSPFVPGHLDAGSWRYCASCHTSHLVREPIRTWVTA